MLSLLLRDQLTDRVNSPIRRQLLSHIPDGATVLEIGCANGRLLIEAAARLHRGVGLDLDATMLATAEARARRAGASTLRFFCADAGRLAELGLGSFDIAIASLCLHAMDTATAIHVLKELGRHATKVLLVDFCYPPTIASRIAVHCDEILSGHYRRFLEYRATGGLPSHISAAGLYVRAEEAMQASYLRLWICGSRAGGSDAATSRPT